MIAHWRDLFVRLAVTGSIALPFSGYSQENYSLWLYSKNITINTSSTGHSIPGNVINFPYVIRLSKISFDFSQAKRNGEDIRFSKSGGAPLAYQINNWDSAGAKAAIWVKIDTIFGNNATQYIRMYWGRPSAADSSNGRRVFDTQNGFAAVYHLEQPTGNALDATANALAATPTGNVPALATGMIGSAQSFDGNGDYYNAGTGAPFNMSVVRTFSVSAWVYRQGAGADAWEGIATKFAWQAGNYREYELMCNGDFTLNVSSDGTGGTETIVRSGTAANDNTWYYVAGTMDGAVMRLYVNGALTASANKTAVYNSANAPFLIAKGDGAQAFNGKIDEVRVSRVARSSDWIRLCYRNQAGFDTPLLIQYPQRDIVLSPYIFIDTIAPYCEGGAVDSFTISRMLPFYLAFNSTNGMITGWADNVSGSATYYIRAYSGSYFAEDTITITVLPEVSLFPPSANHERAVEPKLMGIARGSSSPDQKILFLIGSAAGIENIRFTIYDLRGTAAGSTILDGKHIGTGLQSVAIARTGARIRTGVYLIEMSVQRSSGSTNRYMQSAVIADQF